MCRDKIIILKKNLVHILLKFEIFFGIYNFLVLLNIFLGFKLMCLGFIFGDFQWKMMFGFKSFYFLRSLCSLDGGHFGNGQCRK